MNYRIIKSETNFGRSVYIYVDDVAVARISDHSCGVIRAMEYLLHISAYNPFKYVEENLNIILMQLEQEFIKKAIVEEKIKNAVDMLAKYNDKNLRKVFLKDEQIFVQFAFSGILYNMPIEKYINVVEGREVLIRKTKSGKRLVYKKGE